MLTTPEKRELFKLGLSAQFDLEDTLNIDPDDISDAIKGGDSNPDEAMTFILEHQKAIEEAASVQNFLAFKDQLTDRYFKE